MTTREKLEFKEILKKRISEHPHLIQPERHSLETDEMALFGLECQELLVKMNREITDLKSEIYSLQGEIRDLRDELDEAEFSNGNV